MKSYALQELYDLESTYWWHVGRMYIIDCQLSKLSQGSKKLKILNIGSGTGGTIPMLEKHGQVTNVDTSKEALDFLKKSGHKGTLVNGQKLPFEDASFDLITALDVVEHIKYDSKAVKEWSKVLKPGGSIVVTVPAYQWLWSQHDVINNHYRRYKRKQLRQIIESAGYSVTKSSYMIVFSFPLVVLSRFISKLKGEDPEDYSSFVRVPHFVNSLFISLLKLEGKMQKHINFPFGTSVIVIGKKD